MIVDMISAALANSDLFWTALGASAQMLEALVVTVSAIVVVFQVKRMRQESVRDRISGLKTALEVLDSELFRKVVRQATTGARIQGVNWNELLDQIDLAALLVAQGYTDESLFLKLRGHELSSIAGYLRKASSTSDFQLDLNIQHPSAQWLLNEAHEWVEKESLAQR